MNKKYKKTEVTYETRRYCKLDSNFTQISNDIFLITDNSYQIAVYVYLCKNFNGQYQYAYPTIKDISIGTHIGETTIKKTIKQLEDLGLIKRKKYDKQKEGGFSNNCYYIYYPVIYKMEEKVPNLTSEDLEQIQEGEKIIIKDIIIDDINEDENEE